ncbi:MAG: hypothetical protein ACOVP4_00420 [Bacteriovoracaceae bacterium]
MTDLKDPDLKEIVEEFCNESDELIDLLYSSLDDFEETSNAQALEQFGQIIDRIMGAAKSIGAQKTGQFSELGKVIGYKSSQTNDPQLLKITHAVLSDNVNIVETLLKNIRKTQEEKVDGINLEAFGSRLKWLSEKFKHIERASVAIEQKKSQMDQSSIDDLLKNLGL